jgi:hypothetical protein
MAATTSPENSDVTIDLPADRRYESTENAELDDALVTAIGKAEDAGNDYLATILRNELKSLFYSTR